MKARIWCVGSWILPFALAWTCLACATVPNRPSGAELEIRWELLRIDPVQIRAHSELTIVNRSTATLNRNWAIYFNFARRVIPESVSREAVIERINGDFQRLTPSDSFESLPPNGEMVIRFESGHWITNLSDAPAGFYIVFETEGREMAPEIIDAVSYLPIQRPEQTLRSEADRIEVPTAESRFRANEAVHLLAPEDAPRVIPTPLSEVYGSGSVEIDPSWRIHYSNGLEREAQFLQAALDPLLAARLTLAESGEGGPEVMLLRIGAVSGISGSSGEAYRLEASRNQGIAITANDSAGAFYGIQTLRALLPADAYGRSSGPLPVPEVEIVDAPRFPYRGLHLDVARNFHGVELVGKLLDVMAFYKLNRFHFHITEDEGWRIEIGPLPELTEIGGRRGHTLTDEEYLMPSYGSGPFPGAPPGSGHYTRSEFTQILQLAHSRHIKVIPEIDIPGHARAAIKAMDARHRKLSEEGRVEDAERFLLRDPHDESEYSSVQGWNDNVINVCRESTYRFLETVVDELIEIYQEAGVPLQVVHIGGDEVPEGVWERSPACRSLIDREPDLNGTGDLFGYFLGRTGRILSERNLVLAGWEEVALMHPPDQPQASIPNPSFVKEGFRPHVWNSIWGWGGEENAYRLANAGYPVVICNASNFYFDLAYNRDPEEIGYDWAGFVDNRKPWEFSPFNLYASARYNVLGNPISPDTYANAANLTDAGRGNILGLQGQLWGENAKTPERVEYMALPRMLGLAERAWAPAPDWELVADRERRDALQQPDWNRFANAVGQRDLPRLDHLAGGFQYRLPLPGAVVEEGVLRANVEFPGLQIRYTTDGTEPTIDSPLYAAPVRVEGVVRLKTFDTRGRGSRTAIVTP
jgi:hexosaminidase